MTFDEVSRLVDHASQTRSFRAKIIYDFIVSNDITNILELGIAHGATSCYMAAALQEKRAGHVTTMDLESAKSREPNISTLLSRTRLEEYVTPVFAKRSYTWELMKLIERQTHDNRCEPIFEFCYLDGAHSWEADGLAFYLVEKLLKPGGWILFDDLYWTFELMMKDDPGWVGAMPRDERETPQVERIFTLLVCQNPQFHNFSVRDGWAWAQKRHADDGETQVANADVLNRVYSHQGIKADLIAIANKLRHGAARREIRRRNAGMGRSEEDKTGASPRSPRDR